MEATFDRLIRKYADLESCLPDIRRAFELLVETYRGGGKVLICGNGGSAADSEHIVGELMKSFLRPRPLPAELCEKLTALFPVEGRYLADRLEGALPAISLVSQVSLSSAFGNDVAPDLIFAQQVHGYGRPGDALIAISTSGRSRNVLHALRVARAVGLSTVGLCAGDGGEMKALCDAAVRVPGEQSPDIQERQQAVYHALCARLEEEFFPG